MNETLAIDHPSPMPDTGIGSSIAMLVIDDATWFCEGHVFTKAADYLPMVERLAPSWQKYCTVYKGKVKDGIFRGIAIGGTVK